MRLSGMKWHPLNGQITMQVFGNFFLLGISIEPPFAESIAQV
jgi:hypothetical protein